MFFPIRTDRALRRTPWVNYALILANFLVFVLTYEQLASANSYRSQGVPLDTIIEQFPAYQGILTPGHAHWWQFITYQFLHQDTMHLLGNMLFLFVFGNNVEDRLGRMSYLCFYLAGGVIAGIGHALLEPSPVLGASGAVAAVSGAYLVWFPLSNVTIVYWFFFIGAFEVSSMYLIFFQIGVDAFQYLAHFGGVAYLAHLSGYLFGFLIAMGLLRARLLPREPYDLLAMIHHRRRRAQFAALTRQGYKPWHSDGPDQPAPNAEPTESQKHLMQIRAQIADALADHDLDNATNLYNHLLVEDDQQVMNQQQQLDLANHLMAQKQYGTAARAYELFLKTYPAYDQREQVQLILGLIYARYLAQPDRARDLLTEALPRLKETDQQELARQTLAEVSE